MVLIVLAALFVLLCAPCALACALGQRRFEEWLPLSFAALVLLQLLFGLAGLLRWGFRLSVLLALLSLLAACAVLLRRKNAADLAKRFFDGAFFLFAGLFVLLAAVNYGKLLASWDEFSHWGDVVKAMTTLDVLGYDPAARSLFPEYPPAMALFQYYTERLYLALSGKSEMAEWLLYFAYQLFLFSLCLPLLRGASLRRASVWLTAAALFLLPCVFQVSVYAKIYIDAFLSVLFGLSLYAVFEPGEWDRQRRLRFAALLMLLGLSKALGLAFAAVTLLLAARRGRKKLLVPALGTFLPSLLWYFAAWSGRASEGYSAEKLRSAADSGGQGLNAYRFGVLRDYGRALLTRPVVGDEALAPGLPWLVVLLLLLVGLWLLLREDPRGFWLLAALHLLFALGLGLAFAFLYPPREAEILLGMERYLNDFFLADALLLLLLFARKRPSVHRTAAVLILVLLFTPLQSTARFLLRREVLYSRTLREPYAAAERLLAEDDPLAQGRVLLVTGDDALGGMILRTSLRPRVTAAGAPEAVREAAGSWDYAVFLQPADVPDALSPDSVFRIGSDGSLCPLPEITPDR